MLDLKVGQELKSYREVCKVLDVKQSTGQTKQLHIKDFERYCNYHKNGNKFIIDGVFAEPLPKVDDRLKGNNSIYIKYIQVLLLDYLSQQEGNVACLPAVQIYKNLGMVNNKYKVNDYNYQIQKANDDVTDWQMRQFYLNSSSKLKSILMSALKNLKNRFILEYSEAWQMTDEKGEIVFANDNQIEKILNVQKDISTRFFNDDSIMLLCLSGKINKFYQEVDLQLYELYKWQRVYKVIKINFSNKYIPEEKQYTLKQMDKLIQKGELNTLVVNALNKNTDTIYKNKTLKWDNAVKKTKESIIEEGLVIFGDFEPTDKNVKDMTGVFNYPSQFAEIQKMLIADLVQL